MPVLPALPPQDHVVLDDEMLVVPVLVVVVEGHIHIEDVPGADEVAEAEAAEADALAGLLGARRRRRRADIVAADDPPRRAP